MFYPIENGSAINIDDNAFGFVYKCNLPPIGYGKNVSTGLIEEIEILKRSENELEQYWERPALPIDWKQKRIREKNIQATDAKYVDPYLEKFRRREWKRRLCGVWFWNKGSLEYVTGTHYLYISWWKFQGKFNDWRVTDRDYFYIMRYCEEDIDSLGLNEITKRKQGKTARAGCWIYERTSRLMNHHGGIQSKADDDAWEVYKKAVMWPWQKLPDFFRPNYDINKGNAPNDALMFFPPSKRGEGAEDYADTKPYLESFIDYKASSEAAYDGPELHSYVSDESGKTKRPVSIKERQNTVRYCTELDGVMNGKHLFTTTVEIEEDKSGKLEEDNYEFQEMTLQSNPLDRDENNRTITGLYTYFLPAHKGMMFDKWGYPDVERATVFLLNARKKLIDEGDTRGLSSFKRKNPMTFKEAFSQDGTNSLYDPELLNEQLEDIAWRNDLTEYGDLEWVNRVAFQVERMIAGEWDVQIAKLEWKENTKGKYEKIIGWKPLEENRVYKHNETFIPNNSIRYRVGCDPFKYDKTKSKRRSNCAAFVYQIADTVLPDKYDDHFTLRYVHREKSTRKANEDVLKMGWWCGCQILFERNINHWKDHFAEWKCSGFLMWLPGEVEPGVVTDGNGKNTQMICNYTEQYINEHIKKVYFKTLIRKDSGWLGFKVEDTEKFDEPMAAGITLIAVKGKRYMKPATENTNIENLLPYHKATA